MSYSPFVGQGTDFTGIVIAFSGRRSSDSCSQALLARSAEAPVAAQRKEQRKSPSAAGKETRIAIAKKDHPRAVQLLTKVLGYPENKYSAQALELLGVARESKGQLAHAKVEYKSYLGYPEGEGAECVHQRLAGILTARDTPKSQLSKAKRASAPNKGQDSKDQNWSISGNWSEYY